MSNTQHGYFLIADITGYTAYLSASELEHAQQTLTALLNLLIKHTQPPLIISRLAGDAVISYGLRDNFFQGQTFIEMIEDTYVAFRRAIDLMALNTTCECNACRNIHTLDLKFFVHYGEFGIQKLDRHDEMVGADVIVIHRLLKNTVTEKTGLRAYSLYSDAAIKQLGLEDICAKMTYHKEEYEHLGTVPLWVQDMHRVWEARKDKVHLKLPPENILLQVETVIQAAPEQIWDFLIQPEHFNVFAGGTKTEIAHPQDGRVEVGSVYQCYHGDTFIPQTILEWQPFVRTLVQAVIPIPIKGTTMLIEVRLEPTPGGTRFTQVFGRAAGPPLGRMMGNLVFRMLAKSAKRDVDKFGQHIEGELARRGPLPEKFAITPEMVGTAAADSLNA